MKESTKQLKLDQATAELLGLTLEEVQQKRRGHLANGHAREAEAIGIFLERPDAFFRRKCINCHEEFLTTYKFVSNCSTECRIDSLAEVGIYWNPMHADDMWKRTGIPTEYSIPPKALNLLLEIAKSQDRSNPMSLLDQNNEPESSLPQNSIPDPVSEIHKSPEQQPLVLTAIESEAAAELAALGIPW